MLPLASVATICTEKQYLKTIEDNASLGKAFYVCVADVLKRGEECAFEVNGRLPDNSIALFPLDVEIGYLLFILNAGPTQYKMFDGKMNVLHKFP